MHKEQDLKKSKKLLKEDCDSYFLYYVENDGIFSNSDFILLQDALQVPKVRNNLGIFETKTRNKFVRRYEITKDRLVVFMFYFFQEYHLRNINVAFLREFANFFLNLKILKRF
ncbi:hypothetical protein H311_01789 [Anncaliia algerae PRA109]|nr:hypothetical protein H311_01789 [Anncaliia algerae PRA109]